MRSAGFMCKVGRVSVEVALLSIALLMVPICTASPQTQDGGSGRVAGQIVDRNSGRPITWARIAIQGRRIRVETDLDGRYRLPPLTPGIYSISVMAIGYQPVQIDSVRVTDGGTTPVDVSMRPTVVELEGVTVAAEVISRPTTDIAMLALQKLAPVVADGLSAEAISRTPDSDAADAVTRVTGVSVFDGKFVIVRGLPERYSNTLLNGSELVSPEPDRRVVPLDIFPASLLQSIMTSKTATPDRPADFAGGSVEIRTKEFPEEFVFQTSMSLGYNSRSTFRRIPMVGRSGSDVLGFDDGDRDLPSPVPEVGFANESFAEGVRNVWTPPSRTVLPDLGLGMNLGGQLGSGTPIGYILSFTYGASRKFTNDRLFQFFGDPKTPPVSAFVYDQESGGEVDWGAIANFSTLLGSHTKLGWKNLYTRTASEDIVRNHGVTMEDDRTVRSYQARYVEKDFIQTQVSGEHQISFLFNSRLEWRGTASLARRDEPDNRQTKYSLEDDTYRLIFQLPTRFWDRYLEDLQYAGQLDFTVPMGLWRPQDTELKVGALWRFKDRDFQNDRYQIVLDLQDPYVDLASQLEPEDAFSPENMGTAFDVKRMFTGVEAYGADDDIKAYYAMLDLPLLPFLRAVGGARVEDWHMSIYPGGRDTIMGESLPRFYRNGCILNEQGGSCADSSKVSAPDILLSANVSLDFGGSVKLRLAGYETVSRPDARELQPDFYVPVSGECSRTGNPLLQRTLIQNADVRLEAYPGAGELIAVSGFYKQFEKPIVETVVQTSADACQVRFQNAEMADNYGLEVELRKSLDFLPGFFRDLSLGANFTYVESNVEIDPALGDFPEGLNLQAQSPYLFNSSLIYDNTAASFRGALFLNYFSNRIAMYGLTSTSTLQPNIIERGRITVDTKFSLGFMEHLSLTVSGKNLTNAVTEFFHETSVGRAITGSHRPGMSISLGVGYEY